jgi:2'-5' RNA ligase
MKESIKTQRLFFALWPSEPVRQSIVDTFALLTSSQRIAHDLVRGQTSGLATGLASKITPELMPAHGYIVQAQNLHITLHFVGQVTAQTRDCMHRAAQTLTPTSARNITPVNRVNSFRLVLDRFGHFSKAKIFWMGAQGVPSELIKLQQQLGVALKSCGYNAETRKYQPHVTLMRKYSDPQLWNRDELTEFSIPWQVDEFVLVESMPNTHSQGRGVNYQVIEKYPLP